MIYLGNSPTVIKYSAADGASKVGYEEGTVKNVLDYNKPISTYNDLRSYSGEATGVKITSVGIEGYFIYDSLDTTSTDNGGTVIVSTNGKRWKRQYSWYVNVEWFGAIGDWNGTTGTDNTTAITNAIHSGSKYIVFDPVKSYAHTPIVINNVTGVCLTSGLSVARNATCVLKNTSYGTSFTVNSNCSAISFSGLYIQGRANGTSTSSIGILSNSNNTAIEGCWFRYFNNQGAILNGISSYINNCTGWNCCMYYSATTMQGALQIGSTDSYILNCQFGCAQNPSTGTGTGTLTTNLKNAGIYITGSNHFIVSSSGENADYGFYIESDTTLNRLSNCRGDQVWASAFYIAGNRALLSNCLAQNMSLAGDGLYNGFEVVESSGWGCTLSNCVVSCIPRFPLNAPIIKYPLYAFKDGINAAQIEARTRYSNCYGVYHSSGAEFYGNTYLGSSFDDKPIPVIDATTTPNVSGTKFIVSQLAPGSTITGFTGTVYPGKTITILNNTVAVITIAHNAAINNNSGSNILCPVNSTVSYIYWFGIWYQV